MDTIKSSINNLFNKYKDNIEGSSIFILVILISFTFLFSKKMMVGTDSGWYLARATNILNGRGYLDTHWQPEIYRGPIFAGIIAFYFKLFGPSITSAYLVIRSIFICNLMLTYLLAKKLFNRLIGFIVFIFVLTAQPLYKNATYLQIDTAMVLFILLAFYFLAWAIDKQKWYIFVLSGITMGIAFLTKQTAGVYCALPILLFLLNPKLRGTRFIRYWIYFYISLIIVLLPWFLYLHSVGENPLYELQKGIDIITNPAKGQAGINEVNGNSSVNIITGLNNYFSLLYRYYEIDFADIFILAPIMVIAWIKLTYDYIKTRRVQILLVLSAGLLYLPLTPIQANVDFSPRHSLIFYIFSFIALAAAFWPSEKATLKNQEKYKFSLFLYSIVITIFIVLQVFVGNNSWLKAVKDSPPAFSFNEPSIAYSDYWSAKSFANWFSDHSIENPKLLATDIFGNFLYFFSLNSNPISDFPTYVSKFDKENSNIHNGWLAIWNYRGWYGLNQVRTRVIAISEHDFLQVINENDIEYVIISLRSFPLIYYSYNHPDIALIVGPDRFGNFIFQVSDDVKPIATYSNDLYEFQTGIATIKFLNRLEERRPTVYENLKEVYFKGVLNLSDKKIIAMKNRAYPVFDEISSMSHLSYIERVYDDNGMEGILYSIRFQENKLLWVEYKTGIKTLLTTMYLYIGDYEKALQNIEDVLAESPDDKFAKNLYILTKLAIENALPPENTIMIYKELIEPAPHSRVDESAFETSIGK